MKELEPEQFLETYHPTLVGKRYHYFDSLGSTNQKLRELGGEEGTVVVAGSQGSGRGRLQREWFSPEGGLWFSVKLLPRPDNITILPLLAGVAVADTLSWLGLDAGIKWPNDVLVNGRKICGILVEGDRSGAIVGIGINANLSLSDLPENVRETATTIRQELGTDVDIGLVLARILEALEEFYLSYRRGGDKEILNSWRSRSATLGKMVKVETPGGTMVGEAVGIDHGGALILNIDGEDITVLAGDCIHLR